MDNMKKPAATLAALLMMSSAYAELETDRIAGECAGLWATKNWLSEQERRAGVTNAIRMADNQDRAFTFTNAWLDKLKRYAGNKTMIDGMVFSATGDCRKIGIH